MTETCSMLRLRKTNDKYPASCMKTNFIDLDVILPKPIKNPFVLYLPTVAFQFASIVNLWSP